MRVRGIVAALFFTATPALAQSAGTAPNLDALERDEGSTSFEGARDSMNRHAWYVAPTLGATYVNGGFSPIYGVRGAFRIDKKLGIGLSANGFDFDGDNAGQELEGGYGGVLLEYVLLEGERLQLFSGSTVGGGAFCESVPDEYTCKGAHGFFATEPTLNVEVHATSHMRFSAGAGYRFVLAHESRGVTGNELGGFVSRLALEFGDF